MGRLAEIDGDQVYTYELYAYCTWCETEVETHGDYYGNHHCAICGTMHGMSEDEVDAGEHAVLFKKRNFKEFVSYDFLEEYQNELLTEIQNTAGTGYSHGIDFARMLLTRKLKRE